MPGDERADAVVRVADAIRALESRGVADAALRRRVSQCMTTWQIAGDLTTDLDATIVDAVRAIPRTDSPDAVDTAHESLLATLEPTHRSMRGAFFTPVPLARFVLRQAYEIVSERFAREPLAVVDPAAGAGVFVELARHAFESASARFVAQEIDDATTGVLRARFASDARVTVRHVDTLSDREAWARDREVLVVVGNPPFRGRSNSNSALAGGLLRGVDPSSEAAGESYYHVDGVPLGERNPKWLQDDCVKFVRYAQWQLERAQRGVVALVCTQAFVHQPTFRAMRNSLSRAHHEVRVLDLHGNTKKLECAPDGSKDENVFEIQQGVCVLVLVRDGEPKTNRRVLFADVWGRRREKLAALDGSIAWRETVPSPPRFAFAPEDDRLRGEYEAGISLEALFERFSPAVVTGRDGFAVARDALAMRERLDAIDSASLDDDAFRARYLRPRDRLDVATARHRTRVRHDASERIVPCLYRPFDERVFLDVDPWIERPRREVMRAFDATDAIAMLARRQSPPARPAPFVFATRLVPIDGVIRSDNHGSESVFPLAIDGRTNLTPDAVARFVSALGRTPADREVFAYAYAMLHAPAYRARFATFLRQDYPRVPLPRDGSAFERLARLGESLLACHLHWGDRDVSMSVPSVSFRVRTPRFVDGAIDAGARFAPVSEAAWGFAIGGYQPLRKWLDDRVGETLDALAIETFARIVAAVEETLVIGRAIDDRSQRARNDSFNAP